MSFKELFDALQGNVITILFKNEPVYSFTTADNSDPYESNSYFMKYNQISAKAMLLNNLPPGHLEHYNATVPKELRISEMLTITFKQCIDAITAKAMKFKLTRYNDVSDLFIHLSKLRDNFWSEGRNSDPLTNVIDSSAHKVSTVGGNVFAGPNKVSPTDFSNKLYFTSYMISLGQCIMLSKAIFDGLVPVEDKFKVIGFLLGFGTGGFRTNIEFDPPSIFYQPRRALQYDILKQFDFEFLTVNSMSYSSIFSQVMIPLILIYLYFTVGNIFLSSALSAQFLLIIIEFRVVQEVMLALKFLFDFRLNLHVSHFSRTLSGELHGCKMNIYWLIIPGLTTILLLISYLLNLTLIASQQLCHSGNFSVRRRLSSILI